MRTKCSIIIVLFLLFGSSTFASYRLILINGKCLLVQEKPDFSGKIVEALTLSGKRVALQKQLLDIEATIKANSSAEDSEVHNGDTESPKMESQTGEMTTKGKLVLTDASLEDKEESKTWEQEPIPKDSAEYRVKKRRAEEIWQWIEDFTKESIDLVQNHFDAFDPCRHLQRAKAQYAKAQECFGLHRQLGTPEEKMEELSKVIDSIKRSMEILESACDRKQRSYDADREVDAAKKRIYEIEKELRELNKKRK